MTYLLCRARSSSTKAYKGTPSPTSRDHATTAHVPTNVSNQKTRKNAAPNASASIPEYLLGDMRCLYHTSSREARHGD